jgi:hypothetical protein
MKTWISISINPLWSGWRGRDAVEMSLKSLLDGSECLSHVLFSTCTTCNRIKYYSFYNLCQVFVVYCFLVTELVMRPDLLSLGQ